MFHHSFSTRDLRQEVIAFRAVGNSFHVHYKKSKTKTPPPFFQGFRSSPFPLSSIPGSWHGGGRKEMPLWDAGRLEDLLFPARWMES